MKNINNTNLTVFCRLDVILKRSITSDITERSMLRKGVGVGGQMFFNILVLAMLKPVIDMRYVLKLNHSCFYYSFINTNEALQHYIGSKL